MNYICRDLHVKTEAIFINTEAQLHINICIIAHLLNYGIQSLLLTRSTPYTLCLQKVSQLVMLSHLVGCPKL